MKQIVRIRIYCFCCLITNIEHRTHESCIISDTEIQVKEMRKDGFWNSEFPARLLQRKRRFTALTDVARSERDVERGAPVFPRSLVSHFSSV